MTDTVSIRSLLDLEVKSYNIQTHFMDNSMDVDSHISCHLHTPQNTLSEGYIDQGTILYPVNL